MLRLLATGLALALITSPAAAQDKKGKPGTTWVREANDLVITYQFGKNTLKVTAMHGEDGAVFTCKTKKDKDGVITATVTESMEKGNFPPTPKKGFEFSFKWKVEGDTATLSDFKWEGLNEDAKGIVEGEYKKKK